jgi:hypothetical protein
VVTKFVSSVGGAHYAQRKDSSPPQFVYGIGGIYRFESTNGFNGTANLTIAYNPAELPDLNPADLRIYRLPDATNRWQLVGGTVNLASNTVSAVITQLGTYALAPPLPTGDLQLTPSTDTLAADGVSQMTVTLTNLMLNTGGAATQQWAFTASAVGVSLLNPDLESTTPEVQVMSTNGAVTPRLRAPVGGTGAQVSLVSILGDAFGTVAINLLDSVAPATPAGVAVTAGQSRVWVSWRTNSEPDMAGYRVYYRAGASGPPWDAIPAVEGTPSPVTVTGTNCLLRGLALGANYFVAVSAVDTTGNESLLSAPVQVTTTQAPPAPPTGATASFGTNGTNLLMWAPSEDDGYNDRDVVRYEVWRAILPGGGYAKVAEVDAGTGLYSEKNLSVTPPQYIQYELVAVASHGLSSAAAMANRLTTAGTGFDTDGDSIPDWWMNQYFGHPTGQAGDHSLAQDNPTGDGLSNLQKYLLGWNPLIADSHRPTVQITVPTPSQQVSNALCTITGKAADTGGSGAVWCQLNDGVWLAAIGSSNWSATVTLASGPNTVAAYVVDAAGNPSPTNSVTFTYVVSAPLTLQTTGKGTITPNYSNAVLEIGKSYTMTAVPGVGQLFSNWSGTLTAATNPLTFSMQSNMVVQANFVTNFFLAAKGNYYGLFYPGADQSASNSGYFTLTLSDPGTFSGRLLLAGATLPFSSNFTVAGHALLPVTRPGSTPLLLSLDLAPAAGHISGLIEGGVWFAGLLADLAPATNLYAGSYSLAMAGAANTVDSPTGIDTGQLTVGTNASVQVSGALADSTVLSQQTGVSLAGQWPLYSSLYGGRGLVMGWMQVGTNAPALWLMPPQVTNRYYSNGFALTRDVVVARYQAPGAGQRVLNWTNGLVIVGGGNLPGPLTNQVVLTNNQFRVSGGSISNLTLSITLTNGAFTGSFQHPVTRAATALRGTLVQDALELYRVGSGGWFQGTNRGGYILIQPARP